MPAGSEPAVKYCAAASGMATFEGAGIDDGYLEEIRKGDSFTV